MVSPSRQPIIVETDHAWIDRNFFPTPHRLETVAATTQLGPAQVPAFKTPSRPSAFGPPPAIVWPDPAISQAAASFRLPTGVITRCHYEPYVEGFPHPYSRGSYHPIDKSRQRSASPYYIIFYGHEAGILSPSCLPISPHSLHIIYIYCIE